MSTRNSKKAKKGYEPPVATTTTTPSLLSSSKTSKTKAEHEKKLEQEKSDIQLLKRHILDCPNLSSSPNNNSNTAISVAIKALDEHLRKMDRDEKLRQKFAEQKNPNQTQQQQKQLEESYEEEYAKVDNGHDQEELMEWLDVGQQQQNPQTLSSTSQQQNQQQQDVEIDSSEEMESAEVIKPSDSMNNLASSLIDVTATPSEDGQTMRMTMTTIRTPSPLGHALAQTSITEMSNVTNGNASNGVCVSTPVAAIALAFHSALRSRILGFVCTGIPDGLKPFFECTDDKKKSQKKKGGGGGFAAPVRDLAKGKFLPDKWDSDAKATSSSNMTDDSQIVYHHVALRYRKDGMKASILRVGLVPNESFQNESQNCNSSSIKIVFGPSNGGEPSTTLTFPIDRHVNLDSLNTALATSAKSSNNGRVGVPPALHYKALPSLFTEFCDAADLGVVKEDYVQDQDDNDTQENDTTTNSDNNGNGQANESIIPPDYQAKPSTVTKTYLHAPNPTKSNSGIIRQQQTQRGPTIQDDLLGSRNTMEQGPMPSGYIGGDFSDDLLPSGLPRPGFADPSFSGFDHGGNATGSQMGPNHPMFQRTIGDDGMIDDLNIDDGDGLLTPGGLGMNPRFDPYYPPGIGGGTDGIPSGRGVKRGRGRGMRGRGRVPYNSRGDPNPDHQRPPNTFGGNFFS